MSKAILKAKHENGETIYIDIEQIETITDDTETTTIIGLKSGRFLHVKANAKKILEAIEWINPSTIKFI